MNAAPRASEVRKLLAHASSVLVGQLAVMAFGVTDTVVAGRYADGALAALSVGSAIYISVYVSLIGILQALLPVYAELHGSGHPTEIGKAIRQSLYLAACIFALGLVAMLTPEPLLRWAKVPPEMRPDIAAYLAVLALAFAPSIAFRMYATLNQSLGKPLLVTWIQIASLFFKIPLSIWFVAGGAGLAPMGVVGCAWATLLVNCVMCALAITLLRSQAVYRPLDLWQRPEPPDWGHLARFARLGVPAGVATMVEVTSFTLMALFVARLGTVASASHQIAASMAAILYMFPLSLGIAASARASYWIGAGEISLARHSARTACLIAITASSALFVTLFFGRYFLAGLYSTNTGVVNLAAQLLAWVAVYHWADGVQCVCVFLLRCWGVSVAPMLVYTLLLWGGGLYGGYVLSYSGASLFGSEIHPWQSPTGFWAAASVALWAVALVFVAMLVHAAKAKR